jgi:hypothetical protein
MRGRHDVNRFFKSGFALVVILIVSWMGQIGRLEADDFDREPILYRDTAPRNPISKLQDDLKSGKKSLDHTDTRGYLASLLKALDVPEDSQTLVFSKTSLQRERISADRPRALYFNDDVYIGYCQNGEVLEISVADPKLGTVFYTLDQERVEKPAFTRQTDSCLLCHGGSQTQSVPGHLIRSVFADADGQPLLASGSFRSDHTSPFEERFGGWYVTGDTGDQYHLGNKIFTKRQSYKDVDWSRGMNLKSLDRLIDTSPYLQNGSDVVALMVLTHQSEMHNRITRANFLTRQALHYEEALNKGLGEPPGHRWPSTTARIKSGCEPLLEYILFSEELPLKSEIKGSSSFAQTFANRGPRDSKGRSLRELDLKTRLFKYPCSYLIESDSFKQLPKEASDYIQKRLVEILSGKDKSDKFKHLRASDRKNILEILSDTKAGT